MHTFLPIAFLASFACTSQPAVPAHADAALQERPAERPASKPAEAPREKPARPAAAFETITQVLADKVVMTADLFRAAEKDAPVLVCMHMTRSSRGEWRELAPRIVEHGYHVLAVDLRCGGAGEKADRRTKERSGVMNETWQSAQAVVGHDPGYLEAYPDVAAAVAWARKLFPKSRVALVGSSYSATLALVYATEHPKAVDAVIALSPGDYLAEWSPVKERIAKLSVPAYITCGGRGVDEDHARPIADAITDRSRLITFWPEDEGFGGHHGTMTFTRTDERSAAKQWEMFFRGAAQVRAPDAKAGRGKQAPKKDD